MNLRKIFFELEEHLDNKLITVITGMRRVGKSTALKYLIGKVKHNNKIYLDLERIESRYLFNQSNYNDIKIGFEIEGIDFENPSVIAVDEIQLVPSITSVIKYFYDTYNVKFIVTGSSSFYIKNRFSESLAGRKRIFEMFPLSFTEFLQFKGISTTTLEKVTLSNFNISVYNKFNKSYKEFITYGGFPEVVLATGEKNKIEYLKDIINSYIELDIKLLSDFTVSNQLYKLIKLLAARTGSKTDISKLSRITGIGREKLSSYIELLEYTYFIKTVSPFTKNIDREIANHSKFYFADTGLLTCLSEPNFGQLFENSIACQLSFLGEIKYYQKKTGQEIDFILNENTAFEVKETPTKGDLQTLEKRSLQLGIKNFHLISYSQGQEDFLNYVWGGSII